MNQILAATLFTVFLFGGILVLLETGRRWGRFRLAADPDGANQGLGRSEEHTSELQSPC